MQRRQYEEAEKVSKARLMYLSSIVSIVPPPKIHKEEIGSNEAFEEDDHHHHHHHHHQSIANDQKNV